LKVPWDGIPAANLCTDIPENIVLQGTAHLVQHGEFVEGDTQHVNAHLNMQGVTGIGDQGNVYRFVDSQHSDQQSTEGAANVMTLEETMNVVSKGKPANFSIHVILHTTVNANGDITAQPYNFHVNCNND
jgi:hypothetical protein